MSTQAAEKMGKTPEIIYGMELARGFLAGKAITHLYARVEIIKEMAAYTVRICSIDPDNGEKDNLASFGSKFPIYRPNDVAVEERGLDIRSAIACAILAENEALKNGRWVIHDRRPALGEKGLEHAAREVGIERLWIGATRPLHGYYRMTEMRNEKPKEEAKRRWSKPLPSYEAWTPGS